MNYGRVKWFWVTVLALSLVKILLMTSYRSTDFDVHRNWLAITYSLPLKEWYFEKTSIWTLDYPPFFAYFEWLLSQFAAFVDPEMLNVANVDYASEETVAFQRISVMVTDMVLFTAAWFFSGGTLTENPEPDGMKGFALCVSTAGLLIVDHMHFQYNGILLGLLVLTLYFARTGRGLALAVTASILMLSKHLFLPLAPLFAIFLLRTHCYDVEAPFLHINFARFAELAGVGLSALAVAFGPFAMQSDGVAQLQQIAARLFPFGRGLLHTYWAPNVWALYCFVDLALVKLTGISSASSSSLLSPSSGLQGIFMPTVLPAVSPTAALLLVLLAMLPALRLMWCAPSPKVLTHGAVYCSMCVFMFGYHVHEKAVLVPAVVLGLVAADSPMEASLYVDLSMAATHAQLPLLPDVRETPVKLALWLVSTLGSAALLHHAVSASCWMRWFGTAMVHLGVSCMRDILAPLAASGALGVDAQGFIARWPFLPLLATSVQIALFLVPCWYSTWRLMVAAANDYAQYSAEDDTRCNSSESTGPNFEPMPLPEHGSPGPSILKNLAPPATEGLRRRVSFSDTTRSESGCVDPLVTGSPLRSSQMR